LAIAALAALVTAAVAAARPAAARSGCQTRGAAASGPLVLRLGSRARTIVVHLPTGYPGAEPAPLVLDLHGSGSTAAQQERFGAMDATADSHGFVVAYPQAAIADGSGFDWNVPGAPLTGGRRVPRGAADDVAFLEQLVRVLEQRYCVDASRVYATGFSGGARMVSQLACDAPRVFAAVAAVSGLRAPSPCAARPPVPIVAFHGTADPVDPFAGHGQPYWTYSVPAAAAAWAKREGCASAETVSHLPRGVTLTSYGRCRGGSAVELYAITGEGHEWPGGPHLPRRYTVLLGPQSNAIDADQTMWSFFAKHRLR
jgi:polyhydroxybutyrate depolymerase